MQGNAVIRALVSQSVDAFTRGLRDQSVGQEHAPAEEAAEGDERLAALEMDSVPLEVNVFKIERLEINGRGVPAEGNWRPAAPHAPAVNEHGLSIENVRGNVSRQAIVLCANAGAQVSDRFKTFMRVFRSRRAGLWNSGLNEIDFGNRRNALGGLFVSRG